MDRLKDRAFGRKSLTIRDIGVIGELITGSRTITGGIKTFAN